MTLGTVVVSVKTGSIRANMVSVVKNGRLSTTPGTSVAVIASP